MWHFLGAVQRNKVAQLAPLVGRVAERGPGGRGRADRPLRARRPVLVQVDTTGLPGRNGCAPSGVGGLVGRLRELGLDVRGLMTVAAPGAAAARAAFESVGRLADDLGLEERSMGMSDDLEAAVAAGSTMVRIGRALFGERSPRATRVRWSPSGNLGWRALPRTCPRCRAGTTLSVTGEGMSPSFMKKTMVYLGLLDDEYDEYDDLEDRAPRGFSAATATRVEPRAPEYDQAEEFSGGMSRVRTIPRESAVPSQQRPAPSNVAPRPSAVRAMPVDTSISPAAGSSSSARVHVVAPSRFGDAKEIADRLKDNRPVIVNLQMADRDLQRRMIDFCSGVTYALSGEMEKVADQVFLLAPTNVKVSDEERQRLVERGFGRD